MFNEVFNDSRFNFRDCACGQRNMRQMGKNNFRNLFDVYEARQLNRLMNDNRFDRDHFIHHEDCKRFNDDHVCQCGRRHALGQECECRRRHASGQVSERARSHEKRHECGCRERQQSGQHQRKCGCRNHQQRDHHQHECGCRNHQQRNHHQHECECRNRQQLHLQHECGCGHSHNHDHKCDRCIGRHHCPSDFRLNLQGLRDNLNFKLLCNRHRPIEIGTVGRRRFRGNTKHVGIDYVDLENRHFLMTLLKDKMEYIKWLDENNRGEDC